MAAPPVAGAIAVMLAEAKSRDIDLSIAQICDKVIQSARKQPPSGQDWDDRYGFGRISVTQMIAGIVLISLKLQ